MLARSPSLGARTLKKLVLESLRLCRGIPTPLLVRAIMPGWAIGLVISLCTIGFLAIMVGPASARTAASLILKSDMNGPISAASITEIEMISEGFARNATMIWTG
jgi:ABC-type Fe3+ transport system permease subunit